MIERVHVTRKRRDSLDNRILVCHRVLIRVAVVALLGGYSVGCVNRVVEAGTDTYEGEAILAALEHVAAIKWRQPETTTVRGKAAVAYSDEVRLSESTRAFLDDAFVARGWRWSTEDPLVPTGNCFFPHGDCRLKDPTELHLTFSVEPSTNEMAHSVHVTWLSSFHWDGGHQAELGGQEMSVTRSPEGWIVETSMEWIT